MSFYFIFLCVEPITFYPLEGELIKITVASTSESVTIPCISKKRWASGLKVFVKNVRSANSAKGN